MAEVPLSWRLSITGAEDVRARLSDLQGQFARGEINTKQYAAGLRDVRKDATALAGQTRIGTQLFLAQHPAVGNLTRAMSTFGSIMRTTLAVSNAMNLAILAFNSSSGQLSQATADVAQAQREYLDAVEKFGAGSPQAEQALDNLTAAFARYKEQVDEVNKQKFSNLITTAASIGLIASSIAQVLPKIGSLKGALAGLTGLNVGASLSGIGAAGPALAALIGAASVLALTIAAVAASFALIGYMAVREGDQAADAMAAVTDAIIGGLGPSIIGPIATAWQNFWVNTQYELERTGVAWQILGSRIVDAFNPFLGGGKSELTKQLEGHFQNLKAVQEQIIESNNAYAENLFKTPEGVEVWKLRTKELIDLSSKMLGGEGLSEFRARKALAPEAMVDVKKEMTEIQTFWKQQFASELAARKAALPANAQANTVLADIDKLFGTNWSAAGNQAGASYTQGVNETLANSEINMPDIDTEKWNEQTIADAERFIKDYESRVTKQLEQQQGRETVIQRLEIVGGAKELDRTANVMINVNRDELDAAMATLAGLAPQLDVSLQIDTAGIEEAKKKLGEVEASLLPLIGGFSIEDILKLGDKNLGPEIAEKTMAIRELRQEIDQLGRGGTNAEIVKLERTLRSLAGALSEEKLREFAKPSRTGMPGVGSEVLDVLKQLDAARAALAQTNAQPLTTNTAAALASGNQLVDQAKEQSMSYNQTWNQALGTTADQYSGFSNTVVSTTESMASTVEARITVMTNTIIAAVNRALAMIRKVQSTGIAIGGISKFPSAAINTEPAKIAPQPTAQQMATYKTMKSSLPASVAERYAKQVGIIPSAMGFHGEVSQPTLFLAGEAGRETVNITPKTTGEVYGTGSTSSGGMIINHYHQYKIEGSVWSEKELFDRIDSRQQNELRRRNLKGFV